MLLVPVLGEAALAVAHAKDGCIGALHVEHGAGDLAAGALGRLGAAAVDLHLAGAEGVGHAGQELVVVVRADGVDGADGGEQVVHVGLHQAVFGRHLLGAATALVEVALFIRAATVPFAPLLEGAAEVLGGHDVLPLDAARALLVLGRDEARRQTDVLLLVEGVAAVERHAMVEVDLALEHLLRVTEVFVRGVSRSEGAEGERGGHQGGRCADKSHLCLLPISGSLNVRPSYRDCPQLAPPFLPIRPPPTLRIPLANVAASCRPT